MKMVIWCDMMWLMWPIIWLFRLFWYRHGRTHGRSAVDHLNCWWGSAPQGANNLSFLLVQNNCVGLNFWKQWNLAPLGISVLVHQLCYLDGFLFKSVQFCSLSFHVFNQWIGGIFRARVKTAAYREKTLGIFWTNIPAVNTIVSYTDMQHSRCTWIIMNLETILKEISWKILQDGYNFHQIPTFGGFLK